MSESPVRGERRLSPTTRLVHAALDAVRQCTCTGSAGVRILRGFDQESRDHARSLRERLRAARVTATVEPVSVAALHLDRPAGKHRCALLDLTVGASEADRLAAHARMPVPNQPETGQLAARITDTTWRTLRPGTATSIRALPEVMLVEAVDVHGSAETWLTQRMEVRQIAGLHRIHRDELCVTDLTDRLTVHHEPHALRWHHA